MSLLNLCNVCKNILHVQNKKIIVKKGMILKVTSHGCVQAEDIDAKA